jgi:hypothetical protein
MYCEAKGAAPWSRSQAPINFYSGEMMALEWADVNLAKRQLTVARSEWKGHVTATKGGRVRHLPLTTRLTDALKGGATPERVLACCAISVAHR